MRRQKVLWRGFDYRTHQTVVWPREEWHRLIQSAVRTKRVEQPDLSLLLFCVVTGAQRVQFEVYDRDPPVVPAVEAPADIELRPQSPVVEHRSSKPFIETHRSDDADPS